MRLLNSVTMKMKEFISDKFIPPYAILSHTWGDLEDECTLKDWETLSLFDLQQKQGFRKIEYCCQQAVDDDLEWVWVDT